MHFSSAMVRIISTGSTSCRMTTVPPHSSIEKRQANMPLAWNMGTASRQRSSWSKSKARRRLRVAQSTAAWVSNTPLGMPVEPEV